MALERRYNTESGGFDYFENGGSISVDQFAEKAPGGLHAALAGSNRKEDNQRLSQSLEQSGVGVGQQDSKITSMLQPRIGSVENQDNFSRAMMQIMEKQSRDEEGEKALNVVRKRMEGQEITNEELAVLPADVRQRVQQNNLAQLAGEAGKIRSEMTGRANLKNQAIDFMTNRYDKIVAQANQELAQRREDLYWTLQNVGPEAFADATSEQLGRIEVELGMNLGTLNKQVDGLRRVKAEQERLRQEEIARQEAIRREEQAFRDKQFARQGFESDRAFNASRSDAAFARSQASQKTTATPQQEALASFRGALASGKVGEKTIVSNQNEQNALGDGKFATREQAIQYFQTLYGDFINPDDIQMAVYKAFTD